MAEEQQTYFYQAKTKIMCLREDCIVSSSGTKPHMNLIRGQKIPTVSVLRGSVLESTRGDLQRETQNGLVLISEKDYKRILGGMQELEDIQGFLKEDLSENPTKEEQAKIAEALARQEEIEADLKPEPLNVVVESFGDEVDWRRYSSAEIIKHVGFQRARTVLREKYAIRVRSVQEFKTQWDVNIHEPHGARV